MLGRRGGADDQRAARLLPQPPVQKEAPPRCAGDGRVGRRDHEAVGIENVERPHSREAGERSEEHTSELQSLMRISYAVFCLKKKKHQTNLTSKSHASINR